MFDTTLGAAFIGFAVSAVLYGVLLVQMHSYYQRYSSDRPLYKILVATVWVLETIHSAFAGHVVYHYAISSFGNSFALLVPTWTSISQILVGACISVLVKCAFTIRVWRFSNKNVILTGCILLLSVAILVLSVILTIQAFSLDTFADQPKLIGITTATLATSFVTDLVIAASLTYYLHHLRNTFSSNTLINGLIAYSLETGAITTVVGVATLASFNVLPTTFIYIALYFVLSKLYSNSLLATLNTRRNVRGRGTDREPGTHGEFTIVHSNGHIQTTQSIFGQVDWSKQPADIEVNVLKEVCSDRQQAKSVDSPDSDCKYSQFSQDREAHGGSTEEAGAVTDRNGLRPPERVAWF